MMRMSELSFTDVMNLIELVKKRVDDFDLRTGEDVIILHIDEEDRELLKKIVLGDDGD